MLANVKTQAHRQAGPTVNDMTSLRTLLTSAAFSSVILCKHCPLVQKQARIKFQNEISESVCF